MIDPIPSDPVPSQTAAVPAASGSDPSPAVSGSAPSTTAAALSGASKAAKPANGQSSLTAASGAGSNGASGAPSSADAAQPLRLLIEHDKATNHYVYKLYDSSGRIVREIPQESLADAQKQAGGSTGKVIDTKV